MFGSLVLRSRLTRIGPTTPLGFVLRHFRECMTTTGAWGVVNPPESTPNIFADPRFGSVDSQIWWNVRLSGRYIYSSPTTVVIIHSRKCLRTISKVVVGAMLAKRERRTSAQIMLCQKMDFGIRFLSKVCIFRSRIFLRGSIWRGQRGGIKNPLNLICSTIIQILRNEFIA